jgi:hypothetical protein
MQVRNTTDQKTKFSTAQVMRHFFNIFMPTEAFAYAGRGIAVFFLAVATVLGGGLVSAQAFRNAAPGNSLYKAKLAVESLQIRLAPNDDYRTNLHTEFADRRLDEVARLAEAPAVDTVLVASVLRSFNAEVAELKSGLEALRESDPSGVTETAKLLERKMAVYQSMLRKAGYALPPVLKRDIRVARNAVDGVTFAAMSLLIEKHLAGDVNAPTNIVMSKFEDRIRAAESKLEIAASRDGESVAPKVTQGKAVIAEAKELMEKENYQAALSKIVEVAELTDEVEEAAEAEETQPEAENSNQDSQEGSKPAVPAGSSEQSEDAVGSGSR